MEHVWLLFKGNFVICSKNNINIDNTFYENVEKVALTDSWTIDRSSLNRAQKNWMWDNVVHFVASDEPVGKVLRDDSKTRVCIEKSAGHPKHEYTTGYAYEEILKHFGFN